MSQGHVLAIDQGTTGSTALVVDGRGRVVGRAYSEFTQHFPKPGWVEHDAEEIWAVSLRVMKAALRRARVAPEKLAAIGITNQRETTVVWDRKTGRPVHRAIVWQDRRTTERCEALRAAGAVDLVRDRTGLVIDPYFSGTKVEWILENARGAAAAAKAGRLAFGTIDSWLVWKLSGGRVHATDYTNASRTLLFDIHRRIWDDDLLRLLHVPADLLPEVRVSAGEFCRTAPGIFGKAEIPVAGIAGDQQAALFGQLCVHPGMVKNTYGTGCFVLMPSGDEPVTSKSGLVSTLGCGPAGKPIYVLEGSIFVAGAAIQWLRDGLGLIRTAAESEKLARSLRRNDGVYLVPAFVGLGAPYWDAEARATIVGLTRGNERAHLVRAALEAIAYQSRDVIEAMARDAGGAKGLALRELRVDGGAATNDFLMQFQADQLGIPVDRPKVVETTALGAAYLAGLGVGLWTPSRLEKMRVRDRVFRPKMKPAERDGLYAGWQAAVRQAQAR
ncbi:MAG: glycerol kinase GlpK [Deltaproteobacteria bacterium]|nr:glycerol kinase GlpK [Deltaproteobacteria bacterium]